MDVESLQRSWDDQQEFYLPDREARLAAMLDLVAAVAGPAVRMLDLAGGTGSITRRLVARMPKAGSVIVDVDPVLLSIATATFVDDPRVLVVRADLNDPAWTTALPADRVPYDAVTTATALHWLSAERVAEVYREARGLLRPGGVLVNADHMPDPGLPRLSAQLAKLTADRSDHTRRESGTADWGQWWAQLRDLPELAEAFRARDGAPPPEVHGNEESSAWHVAALKDAGFTEAGLVWRGNRDAVAVGLAH